MKKMGALLLAGIMALSVLPVTVEAGGRKHHRRHRRERRSYRRHRLPFPVPSPGEVLLGGLILGAILDARHDRVPPGYGWIDTDVRPQDTRVFVDGAFVGVTDQLDGRPDLLYLPPGRYRVTLERPGYQTWSQEVMVRSGRELSLNFTLPPLAPGQQADSPPGWDGPHPGGDGPLDWEEPL